MDSPDLLDMFIDAVRQHPEHVAVHCGDIKLTYQQLEYAASALAKRLGPECGVVGVISEHTPSCIVALLGTLFSGGTYCPIDPAYPHSQQMSLIKQADCSVIIDTTESDRHYEHVTKIDLPDVEAMHSNELENPWYLSVNTNNPAYILFTSGSTGVPKPVVTPRKAISAVCVSLQEVFGVTPHDRVLQFASLNWDTCFEEIFPTLTTGATLVFDSAPRAGSMTHYLRTLKAERISIINLPTALWQEFVLYLEDTESSLPESLHTTIIGGEAIVPQRVARWCGLNTQNVRLINTYGCTETTLITHSADLCGPNSLHEKTHWENTEHVPIGKALPHVQEHISESGELMIGGVSLALGYLGMQAMSDRKFVTRDFNGKSERYFSTGDRVQNNQFGELVHLGRLDNQLKIRGIRVEPGAVEAELIKHPMVSKAAVIGDAIAEHTRLIAYVVPRNGDCSREASLNIRSSLQKALPAHLVPSMVRMIDSLSYTRSGKVDRRATHESYSSQPESEYV